MARFNFEKSIRPYTGLGRFIDPVVYEAHRITLLLCVVAGAFAAAWALATDSDENFMIAGLFAGALSFLSWIVVREMDPDRQEVAHIAQIVTVLAAVFFEVDPNFFAIGSLILIGRIVGRTTGVPLSFGDVLFVIVMIVGTALTEAG